MSVNYITAAATQRLQVVVDGMKGLTYAASTGTATVPSLYIGTSSFVNAQGTTGVTGSSTGVLAVIPLPVAGITVSARSLSLIASAQSANATGSGTAANAAVVTSGGVVHTGGLTVGGTAEGTASGKEVVLGASTISSGQSVSITSAVITHP